MAMSTRAKWMATIIADIFQINEYDAHVLAFIPFDFLINICLLGTFQEPQTSADLWRLS